MVTAVSSQAIAPSVGANRSGIVGTGSRPAMPGVEGGGAVSRPPVLAGGVNMSGLTRFASPSRLPAAGEHSEGSGAGAAVARPGLPPAVSSQQKKMIVPPSGGAGALKVDKVEKPYKGKEIQVFYQEESDHSDGNDSEADDKYYVK